MFDKSYERAIKVLEDHIQRQNRIIAQLMSRLLNKDISFEQKILAPEPDSDTDEPYESRFVPMFDDSPTPGSIINKDS